MSDHDKRPDNIKKDTWIAIIITISAVLILIFTEFGSERTVRYDCRDAHWHPDVPVEVKIECKKIMKEYLEKMQEEKEIKKYI